MTGDNVLTGQGQIMSASRRRVQSFLKWGSKFAVILVLSIPAYAQYGGTTGTSGSGTPSYGNGKAIGIGVGAAAGGAIALYVVMHRASTISGCVERGDDGLRLTDTKRRQTLSLVSGSADIKSGERVELKGKIFKDKNGSQSFRTTKVVKDLGTCAAAGN
jgi:hypothetical protein